MIQIRIRQEYDVTPRPIATVPDIESLDGVIPALSRWGVRDARTGESYRTDDMTGEFVLDETSAYFEIVLIDPEKS